METKLSLANGLPVLAIALTFQMAYLTAQTSKAAANGKMLSRTVSDAMCGATQVAKDKSAAECTRICVEQGMQYALLVGDKLYASQGDNATIDKYAGQRVRSRVEPRGNMKVDSIKPADSRLPRTSAGMQITPHYMQNTPRFERVPGKRT